MITTQKLLEIGLTEEQAQKVMELLIMQELTLMSKTLDKMIEERAQIKAERLEYAII